MEALWATILFSGFALEVIIRLTNKSPHLQGASLRHNKYREERYFLVSIEGTS